MEYLALREKQDSRENKRIGLWISIILHIILVILLLVPLFNYFNNKPPEFEQGIFVAIGNPEEEVKTEHTKPSAPKPESTQKSVTKPQPQVVKASVPVTQSSKAVVVSETKQEVSDVSASKAVAERKAQAERKRKAEAEAKAKAEAQRKLEEQRRKEEEARQKAEAKSKAKSKFSSMFGGSGSSEEQASKGQENGKPNAELLEGLSSGSGKVGEGLGERGILHSPSIKDNTQKTGRVIVKICVNGAGNVISSRYTQKGSTTTDPHLIDLAERSAKKYKFSKSKIEEQCGNIVIDFKLK